MTNKTKYVVFWERTEQVLKAMGAVQNAMRDLLDVEFDLYREYCELSDELNRPVEHVVAEMLDGEYERKFKARIRDELLALESIVCTADGTQTDKEFGRWAESYPTWAPWEMSIPDVLLRELREDTRQLIVAMGLGRVRGGDCCHQWLDTFISYIERLEQIRAELEGYEPVRDHLYEMATANLGAVNSTTSDVRRDDLIAPSETQECPAWDRDRRELVFQGQVVKRTRGASVAKNVVKVLDAFQELGWPHRMDDPLPGGRDQQRLHETIKSLNEGLKGLRFRGDGNGAGFLWEIENPT